MKTKHPAPMQHVTVRFAYQNQASVDLSHPDIYIIPKQGGRNDSMFGMGCSISFRTKDGYFETFNGHCAVQGFRNLIEFFNNIVQSPESVDARSLKVPFRTLLSDSKSYNILHIIFGAKRARELLTAVQDIAVATAFHAPWRGFTSSSEFSLGFIRSSEAYFAFRRAKRIIQGLSIKAADARQTFSAALIGKGPNVTFNFLFDKSNFFRGRISVIIGQNGSGKTASLAKLARGLADTKNKSVEITNRPDLNQVLAFIHTSSRRQFTPASEAGMGRARIFTFNPATPKKYDSVPMTQLLVDVARSLGPMYKSLDIFREVLAAEFPNLQLYIPIGPPNNNEPSSNKRDGHANFEDWMKGGEFSQLEQIAQIDHARPIKFVDERGTERALSLGQQSFINFCLIALANAGPSSAFIIDEPENFLHPNLISRFMRTLNKILEATQSIAIIATHSPFVVREVQSAQVHVMWESEGLIKVSHPRLQTLGANVASISNEVFGDDLPTHLYEELLVHAKNQSSTFTEALQKYSGELSTEALMLLHKKMDSENA
ncbi:AAA family ATPase [Pseudomonas putida]|uniref:AAA family ATPase n=1 Tax=Pseudomonas putida TaxID=303 RepID=UPI00236329CB|nr:AAA family ATPase [Pseudomonas putida]MDD2067747.1 AAA family ATPase [Pseudomonas putida]HDS1738365.1 AAA family ATPase [Pseudomonas putida]